ncbi:MAG: hypothetical protein WDN69_25745 [Aliidongia sp.]
MIGLEIKSGASPYGGSQKAFDTALNASGANTVSGVGQNAGLKIRRAQVIRVPQPDAPLPATKTGALDSFAEGLSAVSKPLVVIGAAQDALNLRDQAQQSLQTGNWNNTGQEAVRITGGWTGAWAGAGAGSEIGAGLGFLGGPFAEVTVPAGYLIGGLVGSVGGYFFGSYEAQNLYNGRDAFGDIPNSQ